MFSAKTRKVAGKPGLAGNSNLQSDNSELATLVCPLTVLDASILRVVF